jgi:hypothetical protein
MGNPTLTKILFAGLIITFVSGILITNYANFIVLNNSTIEDRYRNVFYNISGEYDDFSEISFVASDEGLVRNILNVGESLITGTVNVFVTGLDAMGTFFGMIPIFGNILRAISEGIPQIAQLIALLIIIVTVYIAMRYIQSASNKYELP